MGHYFELRPRDSKALSIEEYKQRFLAYGLLPHESATSPREDEEIRKKYVNDVLCSGGYITISSGGKVPCGVTAWARVSWAMSPESFSEVLLELIEIAAFVGADLDDGSGRPPITRKDIDDAVKHFLKGKSRTSSMLGTLDFRKAVNPRKAQ